jgi:hypothetical protein
MTNVQPGAMTNVQPAGHGLVRAIGAVEDDSGYELTPSIGR